MYFNEILCLFIELIFILNNFACPNNKPRIALKNSLKFRTLLFIAIMFSYFVGVSQNATHMETFNASGDDASSNAGSVSYSIGQVFFTYIGESVYNVAQGVQQSNLNDNKENVDRPEDIDTPEINVIVYPNPTTDFVNLSMKGVDLENGQNVYQLYNYQGKLIQKNNIEDNQTEIQLSHLSSSVYILQVFVKNKILKTFKILKN